MELPLGGPALRHYTQSRPRPHRQKLNYRPCKPQETIIESENEGLEFMGRVDEGVEEFFTKKVLPTDALKKEDEESITVHEVAPASSAPCPPPTKTLRRKLGDFFTLKKRRALKSEPSQEGRPKKASIADFIRPLRDKEKDKDKVKEHDKENEKEKGKEHPCGVTSETAVQETPAAGVPALRGEVAPPRRALREGKSQSLILLSGSSAGTANSRNTTKKQLEGQHSFEQKLHLMLQRIGVSKAQPEETQNQEGEMKKAESEGTIIDSKPEPPPTFTKPRTMSASSDTRHQIRPSVSAHESAGKPALLPKPVLKPGPPPTTSGRNTPENELSQIEEGEINTPTKPSPAAAPLATAAHTPTSTTAPSVTTISHSAPDSKPPSSTVLPSDTDICTDSAKATTAATASTVDTDLNIKASVPEAIASGTDLPTVSISTKPTYTTAPTELPTSSTVTPPKSMTPSPSVTSDSTVTAPSIGMLETLPVATDEYPVTATSPGLESSDVVSSVADSEAISVITVASSPATSMSHMSTTSSSVSEVVRQSITTNSHTSESSALATPPPPDAIPTITPDTPVTSSSLASTVLPIPSPVPTTTTSSASQDSLDPISASTITADISSPHTSTSETPPTEATYTTTTSTIHADTTSVTSLGTTATIKSPLSTDADPHSTRNGHAALTPAICGLPSTDNTHITAHPLTSPAPCHDSTEHDREPQASEDRDCVGPAEMSPAGVTPEEIPAKIQNGNDGTIKGSEDEKESDNEYNQLAVADSEATSKEVQEERKKPEEAVRTEVAEPASEKDAGQEEEKETTSAHKK